MNLTVKWENLEPKPRRKPPHHGLHPLIRQRYQSVGEHNHKHLVGESMINISCESIKFPKEPTQTSAVILPTPHGSKKTLWQDFANRCKIFWLTNARIRHMRNKESAVMSPPPIAKQRNDRLRINAVRKGKSKERVELGTEENKIP